jgi:hypothetical protein
MSFIAVAIGGATAIGGALISSSAAKSAAKTQAGSADKATAEQQRQYDIGREDLAPYRTQGTSALNELAGLLGLPTTGGEASVVTDPYAAQRTQLTNEIETLMADPQNRDTRIFGAGGSSTTRIGELQAQLAKLPPAPAAGGAQPAAAGPTDIMAKLEAQPGFKFRLAEGQKGVERSAASRTGTLSGAATKAMAEYNQNFASNEYDNAVNRLMSLSKLGQESTMATANLGAHTADQISSNTIGAGNATAAGQVGSANAWGSAVGSIGSNIGNMVTLQNLNKTGYSAPSVQFPNGVPNDYEAPNIFKDQ